MNGIIKKFSVLLVIGLFIAGCEKKEGQSTGPVKEKEVAAAADAAQAVCPVIAGEINKNIFTDYEGKRIYFCCAGCVDTFKKDPAKYIKQMEDKGIVLDKAPVAAGPVFLCSKCGQIKGSDKCCAAGGQKCGGCGLAKGSLACCKGIDFTKGDVEICPKCGGIKGSATCCAEGAPKCPKCGLNKGSIGCCRI